MGLPAPTKVCTSRGYFTGCLDEFRNPSAQTFTTSIQIKMIPLLVNVVDLGIVTSISICTVSAIISAWQSVRETILEQAPTVAKKTRENRALFGYELVEDCLPLLVILNILAVSLFCCACYNVYLSYKSVYLEWKAMDQIWRAAMPKRGYLRALMDYTHHEEGGTVSSGLVRTTIQVFSPAKAAEEVERFC